MSLLAGDRETAKRLAQAALARGYSRDAWLTLAEIALEEGALGQVHAALRQVLKQHTDQFDALLLTAVAHSRSHEWGAAIDALNRALRHGRIESRVTSFLWALEATGRLDRMPAPERPLCLLAHLYRYLRIFDTANGAVALRYAEQAVAAGDRPADAYVTQAIVYDRQGKPDAAFERLQRALEVNPRHPMALLRLSMKYSERGDLENEYRTAREAANAAPTDAFFLRQVFHTLAEKVGDFRQALVAGEDALRAGVEDPELHVWLGYVHYQLGDFRASRGHYRRALTLDPGHPRAWNGLGWILLNLRELPESQAAFQRAINLGGDDSRASLGLAEVYKIQRRYSEALVGYQHSLAGEKNPWTLAAMCELHWRLGALEAAERCFSTVVSYWPRHVVARKRLQDVRENLSLEKAVR